MKILIDNGHGLNTPGKRSPDGTFPEASYNREIAKRIVADLTDRGYDAQLLVPEDQDIPLSERVKRVNEICLTNEPSRTTHRHARPYNRHGRPRPAISSSSPAPTEALMPNVILISIHVNAAGNGSKWLNATGWSVYKQSLTDSRTVFAKLQYNTSQAGASGQTSPIVILTGKKISVCLATPCVRQY